MIISLSYVSGCKSSKEFRWTFSDLLLLFPLLSKDLNITILLTKTLLFYLLWLVLFGLSPVHEHLQIA